MSECLAHAEIYGDISPSSLALVNDLQTFHLAKNTSRSRKRRKRGYVLDFWHSLASYCRNLSETMLQKLTAAMIPTATEQPMGKPGILQAPPRRSSVTPRMTKCMCAETKTSKTRARYGPNSSAGWKALNTSRRDDGVNLQRNVQIQTRHGEVTVNLQRNVQIQIDTPRWGDAELKLYATVRFNKV